jgi:L-ascorbate metabolism protein UlaG (beta-lactamase superfamily)
MSEIIYLANCALFIESQGTSLLIDGLFKDDNPFDRIEPFVEHSIVNATGRYSHIDGLLFTHCHEDHFDKEKVNTFINNHPETTLLVPEVPESKGVHHGKETPSHEWIKGDLWEHKTVTIGSLSVTFIKTGHISYDYEEHYCILVDNGQESILVTGDMELSDLSRLGEIPNLERCTAFFNPIVLGKPSWVEILADLKFKNILIYHIPSEKKDFK